MWHGSSAGRLLGRLLAVCLYPLDEQSVTQKVGFAAGNGLRENKQTPAAFLTSQLVGEKEGLGPLILSWN